MTATENRSKSGPSWPALFAIFAGIALLATPSVVRADWLVMTDGSRVETRGPWQEQGRMIVFHDAAGNLSSVRATNVRLEASQQLTDAMARKRADDARAEQAPGKRESVLRITDDDVSHIDPTSVGRGVSAADNGNGDDREEEEVLLAVESWDRDFDDETGGVLIRGNLRNGEADAVRSVSVYVILRNDASVTVGRSRARLDRPFLRPGEETGFVARFPGITDFATADFRVDAIRPTPPPSEAEPEDVFSETATDDNAE